MVSGALIAILAPALHIKSPLNEPFVTVAPKVIPPLVVNDIDPVALLFRMGAAAACVKVLVPVTIIDAPPEGPPLVGPFVTGPLMPTVVKPDRLIPPPVAALLVMEMGVAAPNDPAPLPTMLIVGVAAVAPVKGPF